MAVRRSLYLAVGAAAAPVGLCASAMAPVAGVLAGAIAVGLVLLVTAAGALLAADWRAEVGSRQAWAEVASAWAEGSSGVGLESADVDGGYVPAIESDALRQVFGIHRVLPSRAVAAMELPAASSVSRPAAARALPTRTAWEGLRESASDRGNDAGASVGGDPAGHATLERSRPAKNLGVEAAGRAARSCRVARGGAGLRLAVNAGPGWPASGRTLAIHEAEVVVLADRRDARRMRPAEAATESVRGPGIELPSCRGPPSLGRQRPARGPAGRAAPPRRAPPDGDPLVRDNLGQPIPICAAEVTVIETYLGNALGELFASSKAASEPEQA